jgi:hypothetical protein
MNNGMLCRWFSSAIEKQEKKKKKEKLAWKIVDDRYDLGLTNDLR